MQSADQHIRNSLGSFSILPTSTYRPGESNQQPYDNKTAALPLSCNDLGLNRIFNQERKTLLT